ncbi:VCX1 [Symbiodinium microadriaticum]|nr:VCX1 [Symbiodinium microadriaticum]CAE7928247.1 VCX1 [Symbiodinium sp. KB8]
MALQADFKNRGGLQSLFNPKAGNKVFALDSVLPDANRTRPQKPATGKLALPAVPGSRNVGGEDPLKAGSPVLSVSPELEPVRESDGFSPAFQDAVQTMMQSLQGGNQPQGTAKVTNEPEMTVGASEEPGPDMTSTSSEPPKPTEPQTSESRMRRAIARTRWPVKPPERIEEIKNIEVFAERLVDAYGSLTKAFEAFDSHDRSEVTRSQFDAALDAMKLDVEELCGIPASKLFSMVSRASKKPIGALTEQAWNSFFKKYLGQTSSAHLLEADYSIQAALSHLAELHRLQPSSAPRERRRWDEEGSDSDPPRRWCVVAAAVLDDSTMAKLANLEDTGSTDRQKNMQEEAGGGRRRGAVGSQEHADGSSASGDSDDDATTRRRLAQDQAGDGSRDGRGQIHESSGGSGVKEGTPGEDADAKLLANGNGAKSGEASYSSDLGGGKDTRGPMQEQRERLGAIDEDGSTLSPGAEVSNSVVPDEEGLQTSASATRAPGGESGLQAPSGPGPGHGSGRGTNTSSGGFGNSGSGVGAPSGTSGTDGDGHRSASKDGQAEEGDGRRLNPGTGSAGNSSVLDGPENSKDAFGSTPSDPLSRSTRDPDGRTNNMGGSLDGAAAGAGGAGSSVGGNDGGRDAGADAKDRRTGRAGISSSFSAQDLDGAPAGSKSFSGYADVNRRKYQSEPTDLLARAAAESQSHSAVGAEGVSDEAGDATSGLKVAYTHGKEESSDSEVDDEISSIGIEEEKTAGDIQSLVKRVFRLYATGYSKGQYVFIRNPDLGHFMDDAKEALPAHRKKFRRFKRIFESIFDDTIQLQCDMPGQGLRITAGLTLDWFQVFVQKAVRRVGTEVMGFFMALLEAQGC